MAVAGAPLADAVKKRVIPGCLLFCPYRACLIYPDTPSSCSLTEQDDFAWRYMDIGYYRQQYM
ncbi:MAG: hypothetical protein OSJ60_23025 [Lachnospiraceae bacterium]|nr:hypothetical protein [Lachnospiraceae bacterium]